MSSTNKPTAGSLYRDTREQLRQQITGLTQLLDALDAIPDLDEQPDAGKMALKILGDSENAGLDIVATLARIRSYAILAIRSGGHSIEQLATMLGLSRQAIHNTIGRAVTPVILQQHAAGKSV